MQSSSVAASSSSCPPHPHPHSENRLMYFNFMPLAHDDACPAAICCCFIRALYNCGPASFLMGVEEYLPMYVPGGIIKPGIWPHLVRATSLGGLLFHKLCGTTRTQYIWVGQPHSGDCLPPKKGSQRSRGSDLGSVS